MNLFLLKHYYFGGNFMKKVSEKLPEISWVNDFTSSIPGVTHNTYFSASMQREIGYAVYVPPGYESSPESANTAKQQKRYPVIYWLHGKGGDESMGFNIRLFAFFHKAVTEGKIRPALVVCPNCGSYSMFCDSYDKTIMGETILIKELVGLIDTTYMTIAGGSGRAIEGFSMGGFGAIKSAFKFPEMFSSVVTYGASLHDLESVSSNRPEVFERMFGANRDYFQQNSPYILAEKNAALIRKNLKLKFINGTLDFTLQNNLKLNSHLDKLGISYDFKLLDGYKHIPIPYYEAEGLNGFIFHSQNFGWRH
jgi:S-formylglutathione hydrolase FrmB